MPLSTFYLQFILPLPRDKGFEFFLLQFQHPNQILFTSLHAYQTLGPACRPYLTLTHYPELRDSKGLVLMRGEVDGEVLGRELALADARILALYMQAYYVEPNERKKELLRIFHREPGKFNYQVRARCRPSSANSSADRYHLAGRDRRDGEACLSKGM